MPQALFYISHASVPMDEGELRQLFCESTVGNSALGITGFLLYSEGTFVQLLEGKPTSIQALFDKIKQDGRHRRVNTLLFTLIRKRLFESYDCTFSSTSNPEAIQALGDYLHLRKDAYGRKMDVLLQPLLSSFPNYFTPQAGLLA